MDFHELNGMTVAQLRDVAAGIDGITGYTQMRKDRLLRVLCHSLHIDMHEHHDVVGLDKTAIREQIRQLKLQRAEALSSGDGIQLKRIRRRIHRLKRAIRRATI